jgi:phosphoenolpyruvate carboxykinase (ATP)
MASTAINTASLDLSQASDVLRNLPVAELVEHALLDGDKLASNGALVAYTGKYTGRTPKDKHTVREPSSEANVWWENNQEMAPEHFARLKAKAADHVRGRKLYVIDTYGGADPAHRIKVRFIVERPYHALFIKQLLIRPSAEELKDFQPDWTVVDLCHLKCEPAQDGTRDDAVIALHFGEKTVLIMGTQYAGEMKKSVFTILNYLLPVKGVLSMHCSANVGHAGDAALFFGLSGTGKTTLSADPERRLIGDDEHGWDENGIFNFEGGCYAKCIKLSAEGEPEIWRAIRFGAVLENVVLQDGREPDYNDGSLTENTRCAYPLEHIEGAILPSVGGHPKNIFFLTCDAYGVLPPISKLTPEQAMFHFLNGYTAKVAGTEAGVTDPTTTFSTCFGAPFLPLRPKVYADMLGKRIEQHGAQVWLVNTGWSGGGFGVGQRIKLGYTRAMIRAAMEGKLENVRYEKDPVFGLAVPSSCPEVPDELLMPRSTWEDKEAYDAEAQKLLAMFEENFRKFA